MGVVEGPVVEGHCDPAFRAVREVFAEQFAAGRQVGAAVAVYADGRPVVDLWGGLADGRAGKPWQRDTPCVAFSCTKAVTATAALLLAERGEVDLAAPVTGWWPEFGAHGKEGVTGEHLLSHQTGLPAFDRPITPEEAADPAAMAAQLAGQAPEWTPGDGHGYHALTYGWLAGEIVRRHAGTTVGAFVRREFGPDLWIGSPPEVIARAARLGGRPVPSGGADPVAKHDGLLHRLAEAYMDPESRLNRALHNPKASYNNPVVLSGGWPAAGMVTTPRDLAAFYDRLIRGEILRPDTLAEGVRTRVNGPDKVLLVDTSFALGYMRPNVNFRTPGPGRASAFGHSGAGGSIGLGDPEAGLAVGFIPNLMGDGLGGDLRSYELLKAAYAALG
ncbi:serine hydrolase domain-containing protein [Actinocorallia sp. A-T 12471]|uniref:serine hydrolase domain-containing protein n=1 Tax=Actinocorallia sp. A-T 12471 TaxID=3089813 RepID=UPI0029CB7E90|nr:serine hydrolase domain-containing protein [Actinocorallia sp. A-T 12471]MDX6743362.1 serine hydrolase domain-containing protein [Actinocorallia sp. A-T 12471]